MPPTRQTDQTGEAPGRWQPDGAIALALTLLAFGLRLYRLDLQSLTGDEAFSILAAHRWVAGQLNLYGAGSVEPLERRRGLVGNEITTDRRAARHR